MRNTVYATRIFVFKYRRRCSRIFAKCSLRSASHASRPDSLFRMFGAKPSLPVELALVLGFGIVYFEITRYTGTLLTVVQCLRAFSSALDRQQPPNCIDLCSGMGVDLSLTRIGSTTAWQRLRIMGTHQFTITTSRLLRTGTTALAHRWWL